MDATRSDAGELANGVVGSARLVAFGASTIAPAGAVVAGMVVMVSYAGFASPLVIVIAFIASLCCASSIAEFARRAPSAGSLYTFNRRGLGPAGGFLTGWMMVFAYALYVPAGISLTSVYMSLLLGDTLHVSIQSWVLFIMVLAAVGLVAYLGIRTSSAADLVLAVGEVAVFAALAITILVKVGPAHYSIAVFSPASSPNGRFAALGSGMIYGITAFAGYEAATTLSEEARDTRQSVPRSIMGVVIVVGLFFLLVVLAEVYGVGKQGIPGFLQQASPVRYLASRYWSPSFHWVIDLVVVVTGLGFVIAGFNVVIRVLFAMGRERVLPGALARLSRRQTPVVAIGCVAALTLLLGLPLTYVYGGGHTFGYLAGAAGLSVVLIYFAVNIATIRAFRREFRADFRFVRHLVIPATAALLLLFPLWGILHPRTHMLVSLLPFAALAWLCLGAITLGALKVRSSRSLGALGRVFRPADDSPATSEELTELAIAPLSEEG
jgi:amino acid transporter